MSYANVTAKGVGFQSHDEIRVETSTTDGTSTSTTTKQLSRVFTASLARNHTLFIKVMFPTAASKHDPTKTARAMLMEYFNMVQTIDETAVLYRWEQSPPPRQMRA
jgi:superoxide dismutase